MGANSRLGAYSNKYGKSVSFPRRFWMKVASENRTYTFNKRVCYRPSLYVLTVAKRGKGHLAQTKQNITRVRLKVVP